MYSVRTVVVVVMVVVIFRLLQKYKLKKIKFEIIV